MRRTRSPISPVPWFITARSRPEDDAAARFVETDTSSRGTRSTSAQPLNVLAAIRSRIPRRAAQMTECSQAVHIGLLERRRPCGVLNVGDGAQLGEGAQLRPGALVLFLEAGKLPGPGIDEGILDLLVARQQRGAPRAGLGLPARILNGPVSGRPIQSGRGGRWPSRTRRDRRLARRAGAARRPGGEARLIVRDSFRSRRAVGARLNRVIPRVEIAHQPVHHERDKDASDDDRSSRKMLRQRGPTFSSPGSTTGLPVAASSFMRASRRRRQPPTDREPCNGRPGRSPPLTNRRSAVRRRAR